MSKCHSCGEEYSYIGTHWARGKCDFPKIEPHREVLDGLMIGDGCAVSPSKNTYVEVTSTSETFLEYLSEMFGSLSRGVKLKSDVETATEAWSEWKGEEIDSSNRHDIYRFETRTHPGLNAYRDWYRSGELVFPNDLHFTPTVAKYWYVSDGGLVWTSRSDTPQLQFYSTKVKQFEKMADWFEQKGFNPKLNGEKGIYFPTEETRDMLSWMGNSVPGFEYKWEVENRDEYRQLKADRYNN